MAGLIEHGVSGATEHRICWFFLPFARVVGGGRGGHKVEARVNGSAGLR